MTIHFFTFSDVQGGSSRQRVFRVVDELVVRGVHAVIHEPPVLMISRTRWPKKGLLILQVLRALATIKKGDIVYLQRTISNKYFFVLVVVYLALFRRKMIFDFDDPVYLHSYLKTKTFCRMADAVITCTHTQAKWAQQFNKNVHIIHIALTMPAYEKFTKQYAATAELPVIGWVGNGPEHLRNLEVLSSVFKKLLGNTGNPFSFTLIGALGNKEVYALFKDIPGLRTRFVDALDWNNPESVPCEIQQLDIGVVPHQSEGEWNKAKTSFKILEYMACGVATVVSDFGEMPYIITDGTNGFIAESEEAWVEKLKTLLIDKALRARIGQAGQERVREAYCFDATVPRLMEIVTSLERTPSR
jgi:glycosyltransferase involved in cell wall biosynthesis